MLMFYNIQTTTLNFVGEKEIYNTLYSNVWLQIVSDTQYIVWCTFSYEFTPEITPTTLALNL